MLDDIDLFQQITREEFEVACADLFQRVVRPLSQLFSSTGTKLSDVASVTLVGGGTRIPKIQALLKEFIGRELGQNLNTDEAPVFGAAFRAAGLSKRFKVKDIRTKDITPYPISIVTSGVNDGDEKSNTTQLIKKFSQIGSRKQLSLKQAGDFDFVAAYSDTLDVDPYSGKGTLIKGSVSGFDQQTFADLATKLPEGTHPKIVLICEIDDSAIFHIEKSEAIFTYTVKQEVVKPKGTKPTASETKKEAPTSPPGTEEEQAPPQDENEEAQTQEDIWTEKTVETPVETKEEEPAKEYEDVEKTSKVTLKLTLEPQGIQGLSEEEKTAAMERIAKLQEHELAVRKRAEAYNNLEAYTYSKQEFVEKEEVARVIREDEKEKFLAALAAASEWIYDTGITAETEELVAKLAELKSLEKPFGIRYFEALERPQGIATLQQVIEAGGQYIRNMTKIPASERGQTDEDLADVRTTLFVISFFLSSFLSFSKKTKTKQFKTDNRRDTT